MEPFSYINRTYRNDAIFGNLVSFTVRVKETDLFIRAKKDLSLIATDAVLHLRSQIEQYSSNNTAFLDSFDPLPFDSLAPPIVKEMLRCACLAKVGPMASVAGALAEFTGKGLLKESDEIVVENGGDIFMKVNHVATVGIFAADSPLSGKLAIKIRPEETPIGICTSSATIGHSISLGRADAVCILAKSATLADAAATAVGNIVKKKADIKLGIERGRCIEGVLGMVIVIGNSMGAFGNVEFA